MRRVSWLTHARILRRRKRGRGAVCRAAVGDACFAPETSDAWRASVAVVPAVTHPRARGAGREERGALWFVGACGANPVFRRRACSRFEGPQSASGARNAGGFGGLHLCLRISSSRTLYRCNRTFRTVSTSGAFNGLRRWSRTEISRRTDTGSEGARWTVGTWIENKS